VHLRNIKNKIKSIIELINLQKIISEKAKVIQPMMDKTYFMKTPD
jgi:hypothetical protein